MQRPQKRQGFVKTVHFGRTVGLGLPLVKAMTELHGGRLTMESTPDAGTTVTIWLPAERLLAPA